MSEASIKNSTKKGFMVPVLKKPVTDLETHKIQSEPKKDQKKPAKKTETKKDSDTNEQPKKAKAEKLAKKTETKKDSITNEQPKKAKKEKQQKSGQQDGTDSQIKMKKPEVSLTDTQYDDIFHAVLKGLGSDHNSQHDASMENSESSENKGNTPMVKSKFSRSTENTPSNKSSESSENQGSNLSEISGTNKNKENIPEKGGKEVNQKPVKRPRPKNMLTPATPVKQIKILETNTPASKIKTPSTASPWGSHFNKQNSQTSSILKELQESQNLLMSKTGSPESSSSSDDEHEIAESLSQVSQIFPKMDKPVPPVLHSTNQRERLEELQRLRNVGVWVYCCRPSCQKQRYLSDTTDPQDVPDIWYCHMNPDPKYNNCQTEEQKLSPEEEIDMIYNKFTAGSLVWARVEGFPWWPAMVDDDPDIEQFYWLNNDYFNITFYHVVFFDETSVTRAWVNLKNISSYTKHQNKLKQTTVRGIDFRRRLMVAQEQANDALNLTTTQRLSIYSFLARYKGPITTSSIKVKKTMTKYKLKVNKNKSMAAKTTSVKRGRKANIATENNSNTKKKTDGNPTKRSETPSCFQEKSSDKSKSSGDNIGINAAGPSVQHMEDTICNIVEPSQVGEGEDFEAESNPSQRMIAAGPSVRCTENTIGSIVEPSQVGGREDFETESKHSQSTIADFLAAGSEDAVVPDTFLSQMSEPFEE